MQPITDLAHAGADAVIVATFDHPEPAVAELSATGLSRERIVTLRPPAPRGKNGARS